MKWWNKESFGDPANGWITAIFDAPIYQHKTNIHRFLVHPEKTWQGGFNVVMLNFENLTWCRRHSNDGKIFQHYNKLEGDTYRNVQRLINLAYFV